MSKSWFGLLVALLLLSGSGCESKQPVNAFVKGSFAEIQQQYQNTKPYVVMFWSKDCAYCMKELELFATLLKTQTNFNLVTVSTDPFLDKAEVRQILASFDLQTVDTWVFSEPQAEILYFDVAKGWRGELPLLFLFDAQNNKTKKMGVLTETAFRTWLTEAVR
jgi:thiol-disulfide isomerase/thioredoxin